MDVLKARRGAGVAAIVLSIALHGVAVAAFRHPAFRVRVSAAPRDEAPLVEILAAESATADPAPPPRCVPEPEAAKGPVARPAAGVPQVAPSVKPAPAPVLPATAESPTPALPAPAPVLTALGPSAEAAPSGSGAASGMVDPRSAGAGSGSGAPGAKPGHGAGGLGEAMGAYLRALHGRIAGVVVNPEQARRERREGTVVLRLLVAPDGRLVEAAAVGGSEDALLKAAAVAAARRAAPFGPMPAGVSEAQAFTVPLRFRVVGP